jgi:hypothetical protein
MMFLRRISPAAVPGYAPPMTGSGRFVPGLGLLGGVVVSWAGFHWDIALHGDIGRERFLTTPHLIVVAGMVLQGCAAVWGLSEAADGSGILATLRRRPGLALGLAAPLVNSVVLWFDNWWHELFGLDVTLWSPPHLLLVLGFVDALLGGIIDLAQQGFSEVGLALVSGSLFGILTIVNFEFDIGYPHFATRWVAPVMAFVLLTILALTATLTRVRRPGLFLLPGTLLLRLVGLVVNTVTHRSLPTLPIGLLAGVVAFDLLRRRRPVGSAPDPLTVVGTWAIAFAGEYVWLQAVGKTWWRPGDVLVGLVAGGVAAFAGAALGSYLGSRIRASASGEPVGRPNTVRFAALVVVAAGVLYLAGLPLLTLSGVQPRIAELTVTGRHAVLDVDGATGDDWVSVFTRRSERDGNRWSAALDWHDGRFSGKVPDPDGLPWVAYWYVDGDRPFIGLGYGHGRSSISLVPDYFSPAQPSTTSKVLASLLPLVVLLAGITAPVRYSLHARSRD